MIMASIDRLGYGVLISLETQVGTSILRVLQAIPSPLPLAYSIKILQEQN
jgi:hypothetical protein